MANTHINVGREANGHEQTLRREVDRLWACAEGVSQIKLIMEEAAAAPDWTGVETLFGLAAGQGETVYNLVVGANTALQASGIQQLIRRLG
jgi:hypothetical protein